MKKICILINIVVLLFFITDSRGQSFIVVKGKVVDGSDNPIAKANVCLISPPCKDCLDQIIPCLKTEQEGIFLLTSKISKNVKNVRVFIEEEAPESYRMLIYDPSFQLSYLSSYKGIELNVPLKDNLFELGDVQTTVSYVCFSINITKYIDSIVAIHSIPEFTTFQVKDSKGKVITNKQKIPKEYWIDNNTAKIALPKDKWILELQYHYKNGEIARKSLLVDATYQQDSQVKIIEL